MNNFVYFESTKQLLRFDRVLTVMPCNKKIITGAFSNFLLEKHEQHSIYWLITK